MDSSPPVSSVHGILQARILEWVAISFSSFSPKSSWLIGYQPQSTAAYTVMKLLYPSRPDLTGQPLAEPDMEPFTDANSFMGQGR